MKIKKGDSFMCIKRVVMDNNDVTYKKGFIYNSDVNNCITNINHNVDHRWSLSGEVKKHFVKLK